MAVLDREKDATPERVSTSVVIKRCSGDQAAGQTRKKDNLIRSPARAECSVYAVDAAPITRGKGKVKTTPSHVQGVFGSLHASAYQEASRCVGPLILLTSKKRNIYSQHPDRDRKKTHISNERKQKHRCSYKISLYR